MKEIKPISTSTFGPVYNQFENKPVEAIRFLIEKKEGECIKAFHRDDIGYIDIVWGENNPVTNEGFGLKHIIEKHGHEFKNAGVDLAEHLSKIIEKGVKDEKRSNSDRIVLIFEFFRGAITLNWHKKSKRLLLTAYSLRDSDKTLALSGQFLDEEVQVLSSDLLDKDTTKNIDSDTVNKKNTSNQLGATEVLEQNTLTDHADFVPTYKQLNNYDHLFGKAGFNFPSENGGLEDTLIKINEVINTYKYQSAAIAAHLKANTREQSVFNLWHFCTTNIAYKLDKIGFEQLRTPNRAWQDRFTGIDCDCFAIFCSCCLLQMGYKPKLAVVAFNNSNQFGHIYVCMDSQLKGAPYNLGNHNGGAISGGIVCDPVLRTIFNKHPKGITKAKILDMNIDVLNGTNDNGIVGFGAIVSADSVTQKMIDHQDRLKLLVQAGQKIVNYNKEMRKLQFMILMNGHPDRNHYLEIMPMVDDINKYGQFVFISEDAGIESGKFLDATIGQGLTEYELEYDNGKAIQVFKGLGADQLSELGSLKTLFKKVKTKIKAVVKTVGKGVKAVVKAVVKYNPVSVALRAGIRMALSMNFRNMAKQNYIALMTPAELQAAGYTAADQAKVKVGFNKNKNFFVKILGGKEENFIKDIKKGKSKKALFGSPKTSNKPIIKARDTRKGVAGNENVQGLGEPVMVTITAALAPIIAMIKNVKEVAGGLFKKGDEDNETGEITAEQQAEIDKLSALNPPIPGQVDDPSADDSDPATGSSDKTLLYVGGGFMLLFIGYMALK